jgi:hypothetical protein
VWKQPRPAETSSTGRMGSNAGDTAWNRVE